GHGVDAYSPVFVPTEDLWITSIDVTLENAHATALHHLLLRTSTTSAIWCSDAPDPRIMFIFAEDQMYNPHVQFPSGYALYIASGTPLVLDAMFHNALPPIGPGNTYKNVSAHLTLHVQKQTATHPLKKLSFFVPHLSENQCAPRDAA